MVFGLDLHYNNNLVKRNAHWTHCFVMKFQIILQVNLNLKCSLGCQIVLGDVNWTDQIILGDVNWSDQNVSLVCKIGVAASPCISVEQLVAAVTIHRFSDPWRWIKNWLERCSNFSLHFCGTVSCCCNYSQVFWPMTLNKELAWSGTTSCCIYVEQMVAAVDYSQVFWPMTLNKELAWWGTVGCCCWLFTGFLTHDPE